MTTIADRACFGVYALAELAVDADHLAHGIDAAIDELLARCNERPQPSPDAPPPRRTPRKPAARRKTTRDPPAGPQPTPH